MTIYFDMPFEIGSYFGSFALHLQFQGTSLHSVNLMWLKMRDQIQLHYENRTIRISYPLWHWIKNWSIVTLDWAILTGAVLCVLHILADEGADLGGNQEMGDENRLSRPSPGIK